MTVAATPRRAGPYAGNGVTTLFPFSFKVFTADDLEVVRTDADGVPATLVLNSDYSVLLNPDQDANPGGTITYPVIIGPTPILPVGATLTAIGDLPYSQPTDITNTGRFLPQVFENALDRLTIQVQQLAEIASRTLQAAVGTTVSLIFPAPSAGKFIRWRTDLLGLENAEAGTDSMVLQGLLADSTLGTRGDGMVGFNPALTYPPATAGERLAGLASTTDAAKGAAYVGYLPDGASAVGRTARAKLLELVSVKDFGALGNGINDDTAEIQAAIDYAATLAVGSATGCEVFFPPGEYRVNSTLLVPTGPAITLRGSRNGSKLRRISGAGAIIECRSSSKIIGLFFQGPVAGTSNGILCNGANTAVIEDCYFQNQTSGIVLTSSFAVEIISNTFDVCYSYGVVATTAAHNTMLERNNFFTCGVLNLGKAIEFGVASDNLGIKDNDFEFCYVNMTLIGCRSVEITGNYMEYHKAACFDFGSGCTDIIIEANWIALGDVVGGGFVSVVQNITGGRFAHNRVFDQTVNFTANALVGFDVWLNYKTGTGTLGGTPWNGPALLNSWTHDAAYTTPGFLKDSRGWVHLRGGFTGGVGATVIFNLPAGYRPANIAVFGTASSAGAGQVNVNTNGDVVAAVIAAGTACVDGISFYVGN